MLKLRVFVLMALTALVAVAEEFPQDRPYHYVCTGRTWNVDAFTVTSFFGAPHLTISSGGRNERLRPLQEASSILGTTLTAARASTGPGTRRATLIVPIIRLTQTVQQVEFDTVLVLTETNAQDQAAGAQSLSTYEPVHCRAERGPL